MKNARTQTPASRVARANKTIPTHIIKLPRPQAYKGKRHQSKGEKAPPSEQPVSLNSHLVSVDHTILCSISPGPVGAPFHAPRALPKEGVEPLPPIRGRDFESVNSTKTCQADRVCDSVGNLFRTSFLRSSFLLALSMSIPTRFPSES